MDLAGGSPNDGMGNTVDMTIYSPLRNVFTFTGNKIQGWQHLNNNDQLWTLRAVTTRGSQINAALKANQFIKQEFPRYLQDDMCGLILTSHFA